MSIDWERVGGRVIDAIVLGGLVRLENVDDVIENDADPLFVWSSNAAEQIGETVRDALLDSE